MKCLAIALALVAALSFGMGSACAQSFEVGAKIGIWAPKDLDIIAGAGGDNDSTTVQYGIIGQFDFNETWAVRLDVELGNSKEVNFTSYVLSAVYNFPISEESTWMPYVRVGIGAFNVDPRWVGGPDSKSVFGYEATVGIAYLYQNWKFFFEAGYRGASFEPVAGTEFKLDGIIAFFGVMYRF
ncbi:MAG: outer membrane beta-barrel protein [Candidatus Brocadiia bacterium]